MGSNFTIFKTNIINVGLEKSFSKFFTNNFLFLIYFLGKKGFVNKKIRKSGNGATMCFQMIWKILLSVENIETTSVSCTFEKTNTKYFFDLFLSISAVLLTVGFEVAYGGKLLKNLIKVF